MSVRHHRGGWETRWRDASGRDRSKRFKSEEAARAYDDVVREVSSNARRSETARSESGVYSYSTRDGVRWRIVVRRSDGSQTSKRGFMSQRTAADARRRLVEQVERREVVHTAESLLGAMAGPPPPLPGGRHLGRLRDLRAQAAVARLCRQAP